MDELQHRLLRHGLDSLADHGFALAGGYALQAHGLVERLSEDIDLFTDRWDPDEFSQAVAAVVEAYEQAGLDVTVVRQAETFARLQAVDPSTGRSSAVDLAADVRGHQPVVWALGPVLSETDAVATKVATVFSRGAARDYLDLAGIVASGRYDREELIALATTVDGGFTRRLFAEALADVDRFPDEEFARYGIGIEQIAGARQTMREWSHELLEELSARADPRSGPPAASGHEVPGSYPDRRPEPRTQQDPRRRNLGRPPRTEGSRHHLSPDDPAPSVEGRGIEF